VDKTAYVYRDADMDISSLENAVNISAYSITDYIETKDPVPLLYQSGYLTIKSYKEIFDTYILSFPNEEVKYSFLKEFSEEKRGHSRWVVEKL
jgi:hypothetical protein